MGTFAFPGNVRQLENICHWLTVMAPAQVIEAKDLPPEVMGLPVDATRLGTVMADSPVVAEPAAPRPVALADAAAIERPLAATVDGIALALPAVPAAGAGAWESGLEAEAQELLAGGRHDVWDELSRRFESRLILTALASTRGRRIEAAQKLGIGRNTITRKIQELGLE